MGISLQFCMHERSEGGICLGLFFLPKLSERAQNAEFPIGRAVVTGAGNSVTLRLMDASYVQNSVNTFRIRSIVIVG